MNKVEQNMSIVRRLVDCAEHTKRLFENTKYQNLILEIKNGKEWIISLLEDIEILETSIDVLYNEVHQSN